MVFMVCDWLLSCSSYHGESYICSQIMGVVDIFQMGPRYNIDPDSSGGNWWAGSSVATNLSQKVMMFTIVMLVVVFVVILYRL